MFSIDYPFEKTELAARFIETAKVTEAERTQVASANATRILHLDRRRVASHQEGVNGSIDPLLASSLRNGLQSSGVAGEWWPIGNFA